MLFKKRVDIVLNLTNKQIILDHLQKKGSINTWQSIKYYGNTRLSQYILLLRRDGYKITNKTVYFKNRYGKNGHYDEYILN